MSKSVAILQSNYIPWKGYFDIIHRVDEFILYDDMQYTRRDWRNRNKIKTPQGVQWLTIPVEVKGKYEQKIKDTLVSRSDWAETHWKTLLHNYRKAPHFGDYAGALQGLYEQAGQQPALSGINYLFLKAICGWLGITTRITWSMDYQLAAGKTERLVDLCQQAGAAHYLSGPAARAYIDEALFAAAGIALEFMDYSGYPEYPQLYPPFEHGVSVLDLLFQTGADAPRFMKSFAR
ncbi:MAG: WbqC family protein [Chloroflexi bacterium]|nr:WbqC family protein [Chloroflexota bacterium]